MGNCKQDYTKRKLSLVLPIVSINYKNVTIDLGSTFSLLPSWGGDEYEKFYFDWLFIHVIHY